MTFFKAVDLMAKLDVNDAVGIDGATPAMPFDPPVFHDEPA
jgi:hypothetical protein